MARLELERQRGVLVAFPRRRLERARHAGMRDQPVQELTLRVDPESTDGLDWRQPACLLVQRRPRRGSVRIRKG